MKRLSIICALSLCVILAGCGQKKADWMTQSAPVNTVPIAPPTDTSEMLPDTSTNVNNNETPTEFQSVQEMAEQPAVDSPISEVDPAAQPQPSEPTPAPTEPAAQPEAEPEPAPQQASNADFLNNLPSGFTAIAPIDPSTLHKPTEEAPAETPAEPADINVTIFEMLNVVAEDEPGATLWQHEDQEYYVVTSYQYQMEDGTMFKSVEKDNGKVIATTTKGAQYELKDINHNEVVSESWVNNTQYTKTYKCHAVPYTAPSVQLQNKPKQSSNP